MALAYRDFLPRKTLSPSTFLGIIPTTSASYETFDAVVFAANQWIAQSVIHVINVKTVVLPALYETTELSQNAVFAGGSGIGQSLTVSHYSQFVRVWYETNQ